MKTQLTLIAAVSADGFISRGSGVPWKLPIDQHHFRSYTQDRWLLIGRKTYQEMEGWCRPSHHPLVLSQNDNFHPHPGRTVSTVEQAIQLAEEAGEPELVCCGGGLVYQSSMSLADRLIITHVDDYLTEGVRFPAIDSPFWKPLHQQSYPADQNHPYSFTIVHYEPMKSSGSRCSL